MIQVDIKSIKQNSRYNYRCKIDKILKMHKELKCIVCKANNQWK